MRGVPDAKQCAQSALHQLRCANQPHSCSCPAFDESRAVCAGTEFVSQRKAKAEAAEAEGETDKPTGSPQMEDWTQAEFVRRSIRALCRLSHTS